MWIKLIIELTGCTRVQALKVMEILNDTHHRTALGLMSREELRACAEFALREAA